MLSFLRSLLGAGEGRSPKWRAFREAWLKEHPSCCGCGRTTDLEVHHKVPFHIDPSRELDPTNVMTLCEHPTWNCHLMLGHMGDWKKYRQKPVTAAGMALQAVKVS